MVLLSQQSSHGAIEAAFCTWSSFHLGTIEASTLHTATWHGKDNVVEYLLDEGMDPDTVDDAGVTPIMLALTRLNLQAMRCVFRNREAVRRNLVEDVR
jgi:ankyrin repeat protein